MFLCRTFQHCLSLISEKGRQKTLILQEGYKAVSKCQLFALSQQLYLFLPPNSPGEDERFGKQIDGCFSFRSTVVYIAPTTLLHHLHNREPTTVHHAGDCFKASCALIHILLSYWYFFSLQKLLSAAFLLLISA